MRPTALRADAGIGGRDHEGRDCHGRHAWTLDAEKKLFVGPLLPPAAVPKIESRTFDRGQEELYLLLAAQRMIHRAADLGGRPDDTLAADEFVAQVQARADYARKQQFDSALASVYAGLPPLLRTVQQETEKRKEVVQQFEIGSRQIVRREDRAKGARRGLSVLGLSAAIDIATPVARTHHYTSLDGTVHTETVHEDKTEDEVAMSKWVLTEAIPSFSAEIEGELRLTSLAKKTNDAQFHASLERSFQAQHDAVRHLQESLYPLVAKRFGPAGLDSITSDDLKERRATTDQIKPLLDTLNTR